jgi:circadian clock protein KaiC
MQIMKLRGQASVPGLHTFRITEAGRQAFSQTLGLLGRRKTFRNGKRLSLGIAALDEMMGGGVPEGAACLSPVPRELANP